MIKKILIKIILLVSLLNADINIQQLFNDGNKFYFNQNYLMAIESYNKILNLEFYHENLFFNLGNAYYQNSELGNAIWCYEKGLKINPFDKDLKYNLNYCNSKIDDNIIAPKQFFLLEIYSNLIGYFSFSSWFIFFSFNFFSLCLLITYFKIFKYKKNNFFKIFRSFLIFILFIILLFLYDIIFNLSKVNNGIVVTESIDILSAPSKNSSLVYSMKEGSKINIISVNDLWYEIELLDGNKGWVLKKNIKEI
tara:strand:+ start:285 stop:1037 length:753 start_codon:yes stop_codon:yes gene_type:complete